MINNLILGDCLDKLKDLEDNSIDSIVTDPPYGLSAAKNSGKTSKGGFMGKKWDHDVPSQDIWEECLRVLKPGGYLLAFAGSRTYHRMAVRIEDAGFEIRDQIMYVFGSGFPKSHNISKGIDKSQGNKREVKGYKSNHINRPITKNWDKSLTIISHNPIPNGGSSGNTVAITEPVSLEAKQWEGWGSALKPAHEPIVMARKPLSEKTIASNVLKWGCGGINIDECRVATNWKTDPNKRGWQGGNAGAATFTGERIINGKKPDANIQGRFPSNFIHDGSDEVLEGFPHLHGHGSKTVKTNGSSFWGTGKDMSMNVNGGEGGSAARFFYCAKASRSERNEGVNDIYTLNDNTPDSILLEIKELFSKNQKEKN